ncbi:hypothetical protein Q1695_010194 [Nippostrongylus brasiliensis]|nr:hypothetical protein Q1695_010194 [Nippostrongylus brasiliensis]
MMMTVDDLEEIKENEEKQEERGYHPIVTITPWMSRRRWSRTMREETMATNTTRKGNEDEEIEDLEDQLKELMDEEEVEVDEYE